MMRSLSLITMVASASAFATTSSSPAFVGSSALHAVSIEHAPYFIDVNDSSVEPASKLPTVMESTPKPAKKAAPKKKAAAAPKHKEGVLTPAVHVARAVMGDETLNKVRGKAISLHSDVIAAFVDSSDSEFGNKVLKALFKVADKNGDGLIQEDELKQVFQALHFSWLQDKQVKGILNRADSDENGVIDMEEWLKEAPKTLRTNLIKLAKTNGGELGLLA